MAQPEPSSSRLPWVKKNNGKPLRKELPPQKKEDTPPQKEENTQKAADVFEALNDILVPKMGDLRRQLGLK